MPDSEALAMAIFYRWKAALDDFEQAGISVLGASRGLATGRAGQGIYRLTLTEAARMAAEVALERLDGGSDG